MIQRICLVLEALSIVICLHHLYGEKFRFDIETTSLLAIDMIMMQTIDYYKLPSVLSVLIYPIIALYCGKKFGRNVKKILINIAICVIIVGGIQFLLMSGYFWLFKINIFGNLGLLVINAIAFLIVIFLLPINKLSKVAVYLQSKSYLIVLSLVCILITIAICVIIYKKNNTLEMYLYALTFSIIILICTLTVQLGKSRLKEKEVEMELKTHQLYSDSFQSLIDNIRIRQHEFNNHINTINSMHYMCSTYEQLINMQKEYCEIIIKENRFNKLLNVGNSLVISFLYGRFVEIEKLGIDVTYVVSIENLNIGIPVYKIVEILGNLINNAVEALLSSEEHKALHVEIIEIEGKFLLEVRNKSKFIYLSEIEQFFKKGFSKKGDGRGIGLYNVKAICNEYLLNILCENKNIDDENWLSFVLKNRT